MTQMQRWAGASPVFGKLCSLSKSDILCSSDDEIIKTLAGLPKPGEGHWKNGFSAFAPLKLSLSYELDLFEPDLSFDGVWFQCPWLEYPGDTGWLIEKFLLNAAKSVRIGEYVCVGITNHSQYVHRYHLENILGEGLKGVKDSTEVLRYYTFLGADTDLIYRVLSFGYHHTGVKDIHDYILAHHATLVFRRRVKRKRQRRLSSEEEPKIKKKKRKMNPA